MAKKIVRMCAVLDGWTESPNDHDIFQERLSEFGFIYRKRPRDYSDDDVDDNVLRKRRLNKPPSEEDPIEIGDNGTTVPRSVLSNLKLDKVSAVTKSLLCAKFSRKLLATHSLTGKPSPGKYFYIIFHFELMTKYEQF